LPLIPGAADLMTDIMRHLERVPRKRGQVERIFSRKQIEQAFLETFELVGGVPRLARWANDEENYKDFLKLLMVMAPKEALATTQGQILEYRSNVPNSPLNRPAPSSPDEPQDAEFLEITPE
jgi:hypothetical protein